MPRGNTTPDTGHQNQKKASPTSTAPGNPAKFSTATIVTGHKTKSSVFDTRNSLLFTDLIQSNIVVVFLFNDSSQLQWFHVAGVDHAVKGRDRSKMNAVVLLASK